VIAALLHPSVPVVRATQEQLVIGDLVQCAGWSCPDQTGFPVARVVDARSGLVLDDFCADCLPGGAGWWARSRPAVVVLTPFDAEDAQPVQVAS
jgi:hypothetical protein